MRFVRDLQLNGCHGNRCYGNGTQSDLSFILTHLSLDLIGFDKAESY